MSLSISDYSSSSLSEPEDFLDRCSSARDFLPSDLGGSQRAPARRTPSPSLSGTDRTSNSGSSIVLSRVLPCSSDSGILSYPSTGSYLGVSTSLSAPREARDHESWEWSSQYDAILQNLASRHPPASAATTPCRQTSRPSSDSSGSSETNESQKTKSSWVLNRHDANESLRTPPSDGWSEADRIFWLTEEELESQQSVILPEELMLGLHPPALDPFYAQSLSSHDDSNSELLNSAVDILETIENFQNQYAHLQAQGDDVPWTPGTQEIQLTLNNGMLAPPAGRVFEVYHSKAGVYKQRHDRKVREKKWKAILANWEVESTSSEYSFVGEGISTHDSDTSSHVNIDYHDSVQICRGLDCSAFSPETLSRVFHPPSFYSHLTISSLNTFSAQIAPNGLDYNLEHTIDVSLGFGPTIEYFVCGFIPRHNKDLRSYRKLRGTLIVEKSLPIAVNLFDVADHAREINAWLDNIISSPSELQNYVDVMHNKKKGDPSVPIFGCIVEWYTATKNDLSSPANRTSRAALKLLMTTTLLTFVPRVKHIPDSLTRYLSPRADFSHLQPKLLTRQIKASIHYLQGDLLQALFCYLSCNLNLSAEVKIAIALLIAFVLELTQRAGRQFAEYASTIHQNINVKPEDVTEYETNMKTQVFDRVRASIRGMAAEIGHLGDILRGLGSLITGQGSKGKDEELNSDFVAVILKDVLLP